MATSSIPAPFPKVLYGTRTENTGTSRGDFTFYFPRGIFTEEPPVVLAILMRDYPKYHIKYSGSNCDTEQQSAWATFQVFDESGGYVNNTSITFRWIAVGR